MMVKKDSSDMETYQIVFGPGNLGSVYWRGSLEEVRRLAGHMASQCGAGVFQIVDTNGAEVCFEERPNSVN
jgi:hypothetical protein